MIENIEEDLFSLFGKYSIVKYRLIDFIDLRFCHLIVVVRNNHVFFNKSAEEYEKYLRSLGFSDVLITVTQHYDVVEITKYIHTVTHWCVINTDKTNFHYLFTPFGVELDPAIKELPELKKVNLNIFPSEYLRRFKLSVYV